MALAVPLNGGQLTINGVDWITPAWSITNLVRLWRPPTVTIVNRRRTGGQGRKAYPPIFDETRVTVDFVIVGECDHTGDTFADPAEGLESNLNYLYTECVAPVSPVHMATLTMPSGATRTGPVQFADFPTEGYGGSTIETTIALVFPEGMT